MKLSVPLFQLKRRAKLMARNNNVPLEALDQIAREEGFAMKFAFITHSAASMSQTLLSRLNEGDLPLMAGHPRHGKATLGLQLLLDTARDDQKAIFFTLELREQPARKTHPVFGKTLLVSAIHRKLSPPTKPIDILWNDRVILHA